MTSTAWALFFGLASGATLTWATRPPGPRILAWKMTADHWRTRALTAEAAAREAEHRADVTARAHIRHLTSHPHPVDASREQANDTQGANTWPAAKRPSS